jgi:16S rRNA (guanine966-N2)-methyltransferase
MRIIAGVWRGRPIVAPVGLQTRPTSDRAREGLFSMLASRIGTFEGLKVADLFAGSGALGFEALSRGAGHCLFVDQDRAAIAAIKANAAKLGADSVEIRQQSAEYALAPDSPRDIIFLDPPYGAPAAEAALRHICGGDWLAPGGFITLESSGPCAAPAKDMALIADRRFGKAHISIFRREG